MDLIGTRSQAVELGRAAVRSPPSRDAANFFLAMREAARSCFGRTRTSETAWAVMLALYAANGQPSACHIGSLARRAALPRTTALRTLLRLQRDGFVNLARDRKDRRSVRVRMTDRGEDALRRAFVTAQFSG